MIKKMKNYFGRFFMLASLLTFLISCEKITDPKNKIPLISFELSKVTVETKNGSYNAVIKLSNAAQNEITVKIAFSGTAVENEHYTVPSKEIKVTAGSTTVNIPITILNDNIWDDNLVIKVLLAPGTNYTIDPGTNPELEIKLSKQIVYPILSFDMEGSSLHTNPFNSETITLKLKLDQQLKNDSQLNLAFEGDMTIGGDFLVNGGNSNKILIPKGVTSHTFQIKINKKDAAGFNKNMKITISPVEAKTFTVSSEKSFFNLEISDPLVDFTPILKTAALLGGAGFQIYQELKNTDGTWASKVAVNSSANTVKKNYLKTHRNLSFISAFDCNANTSGGDVLRLAELLNFATTDTVIADYGAGKTTRFFSPSDSLMRFTAEGKNPLKGKVSTVNQKFTAKLVLKADWETGANAAKQWHVDSKLTGGKIENSTYPTFATIQIELVKIEGTYDFTLAVPEIVFDAWFKSSSPYFMKNFPATILRVKEGDLYKLTYKYYPR